ncbi:MAG: haloacid dehalogenase [Actinobacteria bacterium]|nr:haloacid dehalogenase [Actinomycetota bacterium]
MEPGVRLLAATGTIAMTVNRHLSERLDDLGDSALAVLEKAHQAREMALGECRHVIRSCSVAIRSVHRSQHEVALQNMAAAEVHLRSAQSVLSDHPVLAATGFLHDAEKEYVEARSVWSMIHGEALGGFTDLGVEVAAWLCGLTEAASELRRYLLDRMREGDLERAQELFEMMEDIYGVLVTIDYPDALTGGLRRHVDALRAVMERTRADLTVTVLQAKLRVRLEESLQSG